MEPTHKRARAAARRTVTPAEALYMYATQPREVCERHYVVLPLDELTQLAARSAQEERAAGVFQLCSKELQRSAAALALPPGAKTTCYAYGTVYTDMLWALVNDAINNNFSARYVWLRFAFPSALVHPKRGPVFLHYCFADIGDADTHRGNAVLLDAYALILCGGPAPRVWRALHTPKACREAAAAVTARWSHTRLYTHNVGPTHTVNHILDTIGRIPDDRSMPGSAAVDIAIRLQLLVRHLGSQFNDTYAFAMKSGPGWTIAAPTDARLLAPGEETRDAVCAVSTGLRMCYMHTPTRGTAADGTYTTEQITEYAADVLDVLVGM